MVSLFSLDGSATSVRPSRALSFFRLLEQVHDVREGDHEEPLPGFDGGIDLDLAVRGFERGIDRIIRTRFRDCGELAVDDEAAHKWKVQPAAQFAVAALRHPKADGDSHAARRLAAGPMTQDRDAHGGPGGDLSCCGLLLGVERALGLLKRGGLPVQSLLCSLACFRGGDCVHKGSVSGGVEDLELVRLLYQLFQ